MFRKILFVLLLVFVAVLLMAGPIFSPHEKEYDFGKVYEKDGKISHNFKFTNTGDEPLAIIDVHAS